jgi:hypothetical protein
MGQWAARHAHRIGRSWITAQKSTSTIRASSKTQRAAERPLSTSARIATIAFQSWRSMIQLLLVMWEGAIMGANSLWRKYFEPLAQ